MITSDFTLCTQNTVNETWQKKRKLLMTNLNSEKTNRFLFFPIFFSKLSIWWVSSSVGHPFVTSCRFKNANLEERKEFLKINITYISKCSSEQKSCAIATGISFMYGVCVCIVYRLCVVRLQGPFCPDTKAKNKI